MEALGARKSGDSNKYFGLPSVVGQSKYRAFRVLNENLEEDP